MTLKQKKKAKDIFVYTSLFKIGLNSGTHQNAFAVFPQMRKEGIQPDVAFMNELMRAFFEIKQYGQMVSTFDKMNGTDPFFPKHNAESVVILLQGVVERFMTMIDGSVNGEVEPRVEQLFAQRVQQYIDQIKADQTGIFNTPRIQELYAQCLRLMGDQSKVEELMSDIKQMGAHPSPKLLLSELKRHASNFDEQEMFKAFDHLKELGLLNEEAYKLAEQVSRRSIEKELDRCVGPMALPLDRLVLKTRGSQVRRHQPIKLQQNRGHNPKFSLKKGHPPNTQKIKTPKRN